MSLIHKLLKVSSFKCVSSFSTHAALQNKVGFIGLGNMGYPMAENLMKNGHSVIVYDVNTSSVDSLAAAGATKATSPKELAAQVDTLVTMLPNSSNVMECYSGENGVLSSIKKGTLCLDSSTIAPDVSKSVAAKAAEKGAVFFDAPVSGGVMASKGATLTFMVGGPKDNYEAAKEILTCMGKNIVYCGDIGSGGAAKICNNMLLAISMIGVSETMNLGMRLGLKPELLASILNSSSGRCWSSDTYNPVPGVLANVPSSNDYKGGFGTALMMKDLGLAQEAASASDTPTPLGSIAHEMYNKLTSDGYAEKDFSSVFQYLKTLEK